jgi:hypothetical protein
MPFHFASIGFFFQTVFFFIVIFIIVLYTVHLLSRRFCCVQWEVGRKE